MNPLNRICLPLVWMALVSLAACAPQGTGQGTSAIEESAPSAEGSVVTESLTPGLERATFAGGCFWCMQPPFDELAGVVATRVGYTGGKEVNPTYRAVAMGQTGHTEAIEIDYDPSKVSYAKLLDVFWRNIDPTDGTGQFVDRGRQYRPGIFTHSDTQKDEAEKAKAALEASGRFSAPIVVEITPLDVFYVAEEYHQSYYKKSPFRYKQYRRGSGRDRFIETHWGPAR